MRLAERKSNYSQDEDDLETIGHDLLNDGLDFYDDDRWPCEQAIETDNYHALRVLLKLGAKVFCNIRDDRDYQGRQIKEIDPDVEDMVGWIALKIFEYCEVRTRLPGQTSPTAEESAAFRMLINEMRERYDREMALLETVGLEDGKSRNINGLPGKDERPTGEQPRLPGAWGE
ncbi:hypothetical protein F5B18DRAFT_668855 [Nemania serpens]|nr:hypothetical protein F5B18DRAFT_668855 [Nemania serpens]